MKHLNIIVQGRVQGVGFRHAARHEARFLGIRGFVKNKPDGTVYIEAEGDEHALAEFINWCRNGTGFAVVDDLEIQEGLNRNFSGFEAQY